MMKDGTKCASQSWWQCTTKRERERQSSEDTWA